MNNARNISYTAKNFIHYKLSAKLYVDLSGSRIEDATRQDEQFNLENQSQLHDNYLPPLSDIAEFDFTDYCPDRCKNRGFLELMERRGSVRCGSRDRSIERRDNVGEVNRCLGTRFRLCGQDLGLWKKYFYGLFAIGFWYIYIQVIHNSQVIREYRVEMDNLKADIRSSDTTSKIYKLENIINNMKRQQENEKQHLINYVSEELEKFSSDKTGRTDYALEATGGRIVSLVPGTENFNSAKTLFGITLCEGMHGPRAMLQIGMSPGHCWAIKGTHGGAVLKLLGKVKIDSVGLEHISENISPTGDVSSAPREFSVWGLSSPTNRGQNLGTFIYHLKGPLVQTFPIKNENHYEFVEFRVMSNQGNPDFTCIYRFRVHGTLDKPNNHS